MHFAGQNARRFIHNPNEHVDVCHSGNKKVTTKKRLSDKFSSKTSKSHVLRNAIIFWWELTSSQNQGKLVYSITCCTMDKYSTSIPLMGSTRNTPLPVEIKFNNYNITDAECAILDVYENNQNSLYGKLKRSPVVVNAWWNI